jgi:hypothetical protein
VGGHLAIGHRAQQSILILRPLAESGIVFPEVEDWSFVSDL